MAPDSVPTMMSAQVHLATMIKVLMVAIEFGTEATQEIFVERVKSLRREL